MGSDLFTSRQIILQLITFKNKLVSRSEENTGLIPEAIVNILAITVNKLVDLQHIVMSVEVYWWGICCTTLGGEKQLPMMWNFAEVILTVMDLELGVQTGKQWIDASVMKPFPT